MGTRQCGTYTFKSKLLFLLGGCLTSKQHASVSQVPICSDNCTCCHTETKQSRYADTGPTSLNADPTTPGRVATGVPSSSHRCDSTWTMLLFVGCLTSQQHASVSLGWICSDKFTCCHTEIEVADPTFYFTQSQYTDTGPTSSSADPITPGA